MFLGKIEAEAPLRPTLPRRPAMHWRPPRSPYRTGACQNRKTDRRPANARGGRRGSNSAIVWSQFSTCTRPQCAIWFHACRPISAYQFSVPTCQGKSKRLSGKLHCGTSTREQGTQLAESSLGSQFTHHFKIPTTVDSELVNCPLSFLLSATKGSRTGLSHEPRCTKLIILNHH